MSRSGAAIFEKVSGIIAINEDVSPAELTWRSTDGDKIHTVVLSTIDKLQATPASSEKMMLRLIGKVDESKKKKDNEGNEVLPKPQRHMFSFNNRTVMDNIKMTLQQIISRYKDADIYEEKRKKEESAQNTETPMSSSSVTAGTPTPHLDTPQLNSGAPLINTAKLDDSLSKEKLLTNLKLQQSLLKGNKALMKVFQETVINAGLPPSEFWSTRIPLLRAFALSTSQKVGPYNVLSTIKPVASSENKVNVNLSREKILNIFENYPIVKKAYTDNVPKNFKEPEFWARFFSSKLFRKLRGEKIMQNDRGDVIIDRYLTLDQEFDRKDDDMLLHPVKKIIDLDGNIQDDPVVRGNRPDFTMQPGVDINGNSDGTVDILKGMNRLSEKMIMALKNEYSRTNLQNKSNITNDDEDEDKDERNELKIDDLNESYKTNYAIIHLKRNAHEKTTDNDTKSTVNSMKNADLKVSNQQMLQQLSLVMDNLINKLDLNQVVPNNEVSNKINKRVITAIKINAKQAKHNNVNSALGSFVGNTSQANETEAASTLPIDLLESCRMLHTTCCEFLKHFYIHFQSGEQKQASTVKKLYNHLKDCIEKLNELFQDVLNGDGESMSNTCTAYLKPVLNSITLATHKYDEYFNEYNNSSN